MEVRDLGVDEVLDEPKRGRRGQPAAWLEPVCHGDDGTAATVTGQARKKVTSTPVVSETTVVVP